MARISAKDTLKALVGKEGQDKPRLAIIGSGIATKGRAHVMMKVRPSTLRRLEKVAFGPTYLLLEYALIKLIEDLEKTDGLTTVDAAKLDPTPEEIAEIAAIKGTTKTLTS